MFFDRSKPDADRRGAAATQSLRRIAALLGVSVDVFFEPAGGTRDGEPRTREAQAEALLAAFDRIDDAEEREALIALVEAGAAEADRGQG